mgnify:CR=1 FL=1|jgi:hypothetical protein
MHRLVKHEVSRQQQNHIQTQLLEKECSLHFLLPLKDTWEQQGIELIAVLKIDTAKTQHLLLASVVLL